MTRCERINRVCMWLIVAALTIWAIFVFTGCSHSTPVTPPISNMRIVIFQWNKDKTLDPCPSANYVCMMEYIFIDNTTGSVIGTLNVYQTMPVSWVTPAPIDISHIYGVQAVSVDRDGITYKSKVAYTAIKQ